MAKYHARGCNSSVPHAHHPSQWLQQARPTIELSRNDAVQLNKKIKHRAIDFNNDLSLYPQAAKKSGSFQVLNKSLLRMIAA